MAYGNLNKSSRNSSGNSRSNTPIDVVSNYNFVPHPVENEVYIPDWADKVSHDIPFEDGENGELEVTIEAKTPIFIRNGHAHGQESSEFSNIEVDKVKKYFIPATSIKGMLRNTLEIMSFSKLTQFNGEPLYGLRDLNNPQYKQATAQNQLKSGWLVKEGENWNIYPVEHGRVRMRDIDRKFELSNNALENAGNAIQKYQAAANNTLVHKFKFTKDLIKQPIGFNYGKLYEFDNAGSFEGELVFYGNIRNKHYDFIFQKEGQHSIEVENKLVSNLDKIEEGKDGSLWNFFRKKSNQRIPVFFRLENDKVIHFGMSKLYTQNNGSSIYDIAPQYKNKADDLANSIFGNTESELKGRVFISNSDFSTNYTEMDAVTVVLNNPKASYYPFYLKQRDGSPYNTFVSSKAEMNGFKKYPVHKTTKSSILNEDNTNIQSSFFPLSPGSQFKFRLRYFNLKPIELGALLSALTFHGNQDKLFHSLGGAKPLGYGKVKINVELTNGHKGFLKTFEEIMNEHCNKIKTIKKNWIDTDQIKELFALSSEPSEAVDSTLRYPQLERPNEFVLYKGNRGKEKQFLKPYSLLNVIDSSNLTIDISDIESDEQRLERLSTQSNLDLNYSKFSELSKYLNEKFENYKGFNTENKNRIKEKITDIYKNHKDSRKKLSKQYDWDNNIAKWIGLTEANELKERLSSS